MKIAGLFSGIGGLELPFHTRGMKAELLCDVWDASRIVLSQRFAGVKLHEDIRALKRLPDGTNVVTAGFPCTDLSQAGRTAGINGKESGLVAHVFRLLEKRQIEWLVLENVRNMLVLDGGAAMAYLVGRLEHLGFKWAYRLVDSRFSGVPQRRQRVLFVASRKQDPREVLFSDEAGEIDDSKLKSDAFGFYWTEGLTGLGWAKDAVPPLKGGSTVGIASPPAIWVRNAPHGKRIILPSIEEAEALQGFPSGWTGPAQQSTRNGPRWKLVGNAVTVGVADWLVERLLAPGDVAVKGVRWDRTGKWPDAAYGSNGKVWQFEASQWPVQRKYRHLTEVVNTVDASPLSYRATAGFLERASRSKLKFSPEFIADLQAHLMIMKPAPAPVIKSKSGPITPVAAVA
jgi:DNA (cytosine-5)-methyltransferase 1